MSSRSANPGSIASQLVWRFAVGAALLLFCSLAVLYWIVVRHAFEEDNEVLADKVFALRADFGRGGGPEGLNEELTILRRGERVGYWVRVIDSGGRILAETPGMSALLTPGVFPEPTAGRLSKPKDLHARGKLLSLAATEQDVGGRRYTLQVAQDRSADERFMKEFGVLLGLVLAVGTVGAAAIAITVTQRGLRPVGEMTKSVQRIGPQRLHERVDPAGWPRELQPLAQGFDEMLDRLQESFTRLSQFSADLAHELRTPIANIRGEAEVSLTRARSSEEYRAVVESTLDECERLSQIIDSLLFLARAEAADRRVTRTCFDGLPAVEKISSYYEAMADEHGVTISCRGGGAVCADPTLFGRAVSNLIGNALRFTPAGGRIDVSVSARPGASDVAVSDSGCGIAADHLPRVFDRFYRVDASRSSEGMGLGLALVRSIAELHGGTATIASEVGVGTTVSLTFPDDPALSSAARDPEPHRDPATTPTAG